MPQSRNLSGCQVFSPRTLPGDWACVPLRDRLELLYGRSLNEEIRKPGAVDVFGSNGRVGTHDQHWLDGPGVLVGRKGTVGAVHYTDRPFWPIDTVYYLRPIQDAHLRYLYYLLDYLPLKLLNAATGVPGLSRRDAYALLGAFPPLDEQVAIARILDAADRAIERTQHATEIAEKLARSLAQELVECGISAHGAVRSRKDCTNDFSATELGLLPKSWLVRSLADVATIERGRFSPRPRNDPRFYTGPFPFIQTGEVTRAKGRKITDYSQTLNLQGKAVSREFPTGTIMVTIAANIGETAILGIPMCAPDSLVGIMVKEPHSARFFELCLRRLKPRLLAIAPRSAQANINLTTLKPLRIPVPPPDEQVRIAEIVDAADAAVAALESKVAALQQLKKSLMHDLLTGTVRVTDCDITSPP
jgi:type I restriction enzyme, S subunit